MRIETLAIHAERQPDPATGAVATPLTLSTTFERDADGGYSRGYYYGRAGNPARRGLEQAIAALEGAADALCYASGSAASLAVFDQLAAGDHVVAPLECYHGTIKQLKDLAARRGIGVSFVRTWDTAEVGRTLTPATRLVWIETPANPRLWITDIEAVAGLAHAHGALLACDSTFASPVLQRPLALGADLVMHSSTKYLGGHSDVTGGVVAAREAGPLLESLRAHQLQDGAVPSPFDCWLLRRSLATLPYRVRAQAANAAEVAEFLARHAAVERVYYPGLGTHPGHEVAARQMSGYGAMISIDVRGDERAALAVAARLRLFTRATSLGGVESLVEHRASMEGPGTLTPPNLLRMSIGLEHPEDLIADLAQALDAAG